MTLRCFPCKGPSQSRVSAEGLGSPGCRNVSAGEEPVGFLGCERGDLGGVALHKDGVLLTHAWGLSVWVGMEKVLLPQA